MRLKDLKMKEVDILNGNLNQVIWIIIIPIIVTNLIEGLYGIIDSLFVANVGSMAVASVSFVGPIQDTLNAIGTGLTLAGASLIAKLIGRGDGDDARKMTGQLIVIGVSIGTFVSCFTFFMSDFILLRSGITEQLLGDATTYLKITSWGTMLNFIIIIYLAIERANGNTKKASTINLWSLILKIVFSYLLTIVFKWGIVGIGLATLLARGICAVICITALLSKKTDRPITFQHLVLNVKLSKLLLITAIPLIIEKSLISFGFVIINKYVLMFGEPVLAAYGITNKINSVFFKAVSAFGLGLSVIIAQNIGAGNVERAEETIKKVMIYAFLLGVACVLVIVPFRGQIAKMFVDVSDPTYIHIINSMGVYTAAVMPWAITETVMGIFQGTGYTIYNLIVSVVRIYVLRVPVVIMFCQPFWNLDEYGIWIAMLISNILSAMFSFGLYMATKKKTLHKIEKIGNET